MSKYYLLSIPVVIGILAALVMTITNVEKEESDNNLLTAQRLISNGSPIVGDPQAPITILEWGDYQCTFCYRFHESSLQTIAEEYIQPGKARLVFNDFPLNGPDSVLAAEASHCAEDQGRYWEYHHELYSNWAGEQTGWINRDSLNKFAKSVGLDLEKFNSCLDQHKYRQKVLELEQFGREIGIDATPLFLIFDDQRVIKIKGNQPIDVFRKAIQELSNNSA